VAEIKSGACGYNCATLSLGDINTETWCTSLCVETQEPRSCSVTENILAESKEVKTGCNPAESSKEHYNSKTEVLPVMMMIMMMLKDKVS
jgi:hypothetical protein